MAKLNLFHKEQSLHISNCKLYKSSIDCPVWPSFSCKGILRYVLGSYYFGLEIFTAFPYEPHLFTQFYVVCVQLKAQRRRSLQAS